MHVHHHPVGDPKTPGVIRGRVVMPRCDNELVCVEVAYTPNKPDHRRPVQLATVTYQG